MGLKTAALAALLAGLVLLAYGFSQGDVRVGLFLIIPFVYATGAAGALGMLLVMAALVLWLVGKARETTRAMPPGWSADMPPPERTTKSGGVVLLGPIPIVWGSDRRILPWMVAAGLALLVLGFLLTRGWP
jgi:uncharacterized protein (TIGR00304 family)